MPACFLLSRLLLRFNSDIEDLLEDISAVSHTPDGSLWIASDELLTLERLSPVDTYIYGEHKPFHVGDYIDLFNQEDEIDIEGLDYSNRYLWLTGSQSTKRKKAKSKKDEAENIERLSQITTDINRYMLARIPILDGELFKSYSDPDNPDKKLTAACLKKTEKSNILIDGLEEDPHLGLFVSAGIPSKDNGIDIEGLAVYGDRVFLGLRGPVVRGWAIILEIEVEETEPGVLNLKEIGQNGEKYKKYFLELNGLGIRELCLDGENLIVLAGPTMDLEGAMRVFRLKNALDRDGHTLVAQDSEDLEVLFDLPFTIGSDHAEGLSLFPCLGQPDSLLVVYDSPDPARIIDANSIFVDVFKLKR